MSQSQEASATAADPQPVARGGADSAGNGRGPQQTGRSTAPVPPKQGSQARTSQKSAPPAPGKANGGEGAPKSSWANIARAGPTAAPAPANGAAAAGDKPSAAATGGVKLPAGVNSAPPAQGSIKFGSIDPSELVPAAPAPAAPPKPAAAPAPPAPAPAAPAPSKPVSFAAAASSGAAKPAGGAPQQPPPPQRPGSAGGPPPGRRGPQQGAPPPMAIPPQGAAAYPGSQQPMYAVISPTGIPVYMPYAGGVPAAGQYGYAGAGYQAQFPTQGFAYSPAQGGGVPGMQAQVASMQTPPGGAAGQGYGAAPSSPLPPKAGGTPATAAPARQKKILRIENPDTHEVLNLADIAASKKPEEKGKAEDKGAAGKSFKDAALAPKAPEPAPAAKEAEKKAPAEGQLTKALAKEAAKPEAKAAEPAAAPAEAKPAAPAKEVTSFADAAQKPPSRTTSAAGEESAATNLSPFASAEVQSRPPSRELADDGRKRYNNDFMLEIRPKCTDLPPHVEAATLSALMPGGENDKGPPRAGPPGGPPERDWKAGPRGGPPGGAPGGPPGMRGGRQGSRRQQSGIDADTWERGKALPPMPGGRGPPPGMRMPSGPLPALHKTDSAYKIGAVSTDDPEEEKAQKALKSMLNKITPQNFEKITAQIIEKINERKKAKTLSGFIGQIFDKALTETTFSELYAKLVASLNPALPELEDDEGNPVQFRRTLLNKCQEEFESGAVAMKAVAEREKREHDHPEEVEEEESTEAEEGEISEEQREKRDAAAEAKRKDKAAAEAEVKARKRMLGNIIFVGQLYRFGVLTETVMHSCIKQLLEETENPRSEDVECLCKLLTTVGRPMDASQKSVKSPDENGNMISLPTKDLMNVYFKRIEALGKNEALDSRHRFMLRDLIDLRRNKWVLRREAEGPKKIDEIHRDAAIERSRSQMLDRQSSRGGGRDQRGPPRPFDNRVDAPIRTMNRVGSQDSMGAQSFRPGGRPAPPPRPAPPSGERPPAPPKAEPKAKQAAEPAANGLSEEDSEKKVKGLLSEVFNSKDIKEAVLCVKELVDAQANMAVVVDQLVSVSLESKETSWDTLRDLLKASAEEKLIVQAHFEEGFRKLLDKLDDVTVDVPKAPVQVGDVLASVVAAGFADMKVIAQHIKEADADPQEGEEPMAIDSGVALKALGSFLKGLKEAQGAEVVAEGWKASGFDYKSYMPAADREDAAAAEKFVAAHELSDVL